MMYSEEVVGRSEECFPHQLAVFKIARIMRLLDRNLGPLIRGPVHDRKPSELQHMLWFATTVSLYLQLQGIQRPWMARPVALCFAHGRAAFALQGLHQGFYREVHLRSLTVQGEAYLLLLIYAKAGSAAAPDFHSKC